MSQEIITAGACNANVTISRGELILKCHCIHPIHNMSYNIGLFIGKHSVGNHNGRWLWANVTISNVNITISSDKFWPKMAMYTSCWHHICLHLSYSGIYGPINHKGRWIYANVTISSENWSESHTHTRTHKSQNYHVSSAQLELICWKI